MQKHSWSSSYPSSPHYSASPLPALSTGGSSNPTEDTGTCLLCRKWLRPILHPGHWLKLTSQSVHYAMLLPIGLLLPHYEEDPVTTQQNHNHVPSWLHNAGTSSLLTPKTPHIFCQRLKLICSDCTSANEKLFLLHLLF